MYRCPYPRPAYEVLLSVAQSNINDIPVGFPFSPIQDLIQVEAKTLVLLLSVENGIIGRLLTRI
jgi:hypothetical protein